MDSVNNKVSGKERLVWAGVTQDHLFPGPCPHTLLPDPNILALDLRILLGDQPLSGNKEAIICQHFRVGEMA